MKDIIDFLTRLSQNNCREWFNAHKDEYNVLKARFEQFVVQLIDGIREFDSSIGNLDVRNCTYRIYRDTRFSKDKTPYKTHFGAFIVPGGKKSGYAGYYFQVGTKTADNFSGCMLATGDYCFEPVVTKILREDISFDEGLEFSNALAEASGFDLDWSMALKKVPKGYDADKQYSDWLRLKNFCLVKLTDYEYMEAPGLLSRTLSDFKRTKPFLDFINRAISYSKGSDI